ncbi:NifU family protein [Myxococcota bacterium]|nr:NifU family protein [Myxococcota bacterium]
MQAHGSAPPDDRVESEIEAIQVSSVPTPNPDALMFRVDEVLVPSGTFEYTDPARARTDAPLAARLLQLDGVELVLIAPRFVTVRKAEAVRWPEVVPVVKRAIREFIWSGEMAVFDTAAGPASGGDLGAIEQRILQLLEDEIRPALAQDGGDVTYVGFEAGIVHLRMIGACGSCPSSTATLRQGIEALLREEIPEVLGVEQV